MLTLDKSGNCCWLVEYYGNKVAHFDSGTGSFQEWEIPTSNSNPYDISITTFNGSVMVWGTEFSSDKVFAFTPDSGQFSEYALPGRSGPGYISIERQSGPLRVWFTETTRNSNGEFVYDSSSRNVTFYDAPFPATVGGGAYDLYAGSGYVWFAGFSALVKWDRASGQYSIWPLPNNGSTVVRSMAFDSSGQLWYAQGSPKPASSDNFVGVLHGNIVQEWRIPGPGSNPRGISINPLTQQPWIAKQSSLQGNGTVGNLNNFGNGTLFLSTPITASASSTATVLAPTIHRVLPSNYTLTSTNDSIVASSQGPFAEYALGPALPSDVIADSTGNVWVSEPGANEIVRLSPSTPDYALSPTSSYLSLTEGSSIPIAVTATSVSGYAGRVTFTAPSLPPGVTISAFDPNPVYVPSGGNASSNLAISVASGASPGTDLIPIEGSDGMTVHTVGLIVTITNSTTSTSQQLETRCLILVPIYLPESTFLIGLLIDVFIGAFYIGLPPECFTRRLRLIRGLSRKSWLIILLLAPSLLSVGSALLLVC
jgi:streptogramin lyase